MKSNTNDEWYTPDDLIRRMLVVIGKEYFDLDPCADRDRRIPALVSYTKEVNGLDKDWFGNVYVNPPYSNTGTWVNKAIKAWETDPLYSMFLLVPAATDTNWFQDLYTSRHTSCCFIKGRVNFLDFNYNPSKSGGRRPSVLFFKSYDAIKNERFEEMAKELGLYTYSL